MMKYWILILLLVFGCSDPRYSLREQETETSSLLIGLSAIDASTVWASGTNATVIRTLNGGDSWSVFAHPTADTLQFRDIHAFDKDNVIVLSIGEGKSSRIYGFDTKKWTEHYIMEHPDGFLDCMDFWDDKRGIAYGDSFDGRAFILLTSDGGQSWNRVEDAPIAGFEEGGFAASGTCIELMESGMAWIGTGAGGNARIFFTNDYGLTWTVSPTPMVIGPASGIASVRFLDQSTGFITGGDMLNDSSHQRNLFYTINGGLTWIPMSKPITPGAFYGSSFQKVRETSVVIVTGPQGADISFDMGQNWQNLSSENLWTSELLPDGIGWLMGKEGKILKIELNH